MGDPHAKVGNLDEMRNLILFVIAIAKEKKVDRIEILGDLFHTHAVLRLEVLDFWVWALNELNEVCETVVLRGNHDMSGDFHSDTSSLGVFSLMNKKNLKIIEKPTLIGVFGYVPYLHDSSEFIRAATDLSNAGAKVLVCHQTFQGSKYESGIYAPDGIPTDAWSLCFSHVISGHIHSEQSFGNFIYPGTARWDTVTDANRRKGIWLYSHSPITGTIDQASFISTENICSPIKSLEYREGEEVPAWGPNDRVSVELIGSSAWIAGEKEKLKGKCSVKTTFTDTKKTEIRNAGKGLEDFLKNVFVSTMDRDHLIKIAREYGLL